MTDERFESYRIYRSTEPEVTVQATLVTSITDASVLTYTDIDLITGTTYYYRVFVFLQDGQFEPSNEVSVTPGLGGDPPTAPVVVSPNGGESIDLSHIITWDAAKDNEQTESEIVYEIDYTANAMDASPGMPLLEKKYHHTICIKLWRK